MIEKLKETQVESQRYKIVQKINELVDVVNEQQLRLDNFKCWLMALENKCEPAENPTISKMENVDPYTEQRKWIGKLCRFWDGEHIKFCDILGILTKINDMSHRPFEMNNGDKWEHCEPVLPDDDIIYV